MGYRFTGTVLRVGGDLQVDASRLYHQVPKFRSFLELIKHSYAIAEFGLL